MGSFRCSDGDEGDSCLDGAFDVRYRHAVDGVHDLGVKDVDFGRREIIIREGKGCKDRVTMLPIVLVTPLREQIEWARRVYGEDRSTGRPGVMLPDALERKYPKAARQ